MESLTISLAQVEGSSYLEENLQKAEKCIKQALKQKAELVVFPEMFMALPVKDRPLKNCAAALGEGFSGKLAALARHYHIAVCAGVWEQDTFSSKIYNTAVVFAADGSLVVRYRKLHLFDTMRVKESGQMTAGSEFPPLFSVAGFTIGLGICYDLRFPEHFRYLSAKGADIILLPAAWYSGEMKEDIWLTLLRARAIENLCFVAGVDLTGKHFSGRSAAFDPLGVPLVDAGREEKSVAFTAGKQRLLDVRKSLPALEHRRSDLF